MSLWSCSMAFYISPPGGNISLQKLTQYAVTRFNFLCKVYDTGCNRLQIFDILKDTDTVKDAECLIEGTVKDKVSHFILRLACSCNRDLAAFFVKAETLLFDFRFTCMTEEELCRLFKSVDYSRKSSSLRTNFSSEMPLYVTNFLKRMSQIKGEHLKWRAVVKQYLNGEKVCFMVPFWTVLHLVAARQVPLNQGIAHVPVCKLRETVTSLFEELLHNGVKRVAEVFHTDDRRIRILLKTIKVMFRERYRNQFPGLNVHFDLSHAEVDDVVHMFPPCMSHLHRSLRMNHRLKHHSRIQYSLFLKEAGMSVHEALMFWRHEYSKAPSNSDGCTHVWSRDEGRYTYNIRHLYGLEGSRINYRGHSCTVLQDSNHGPQDSGGCPFSHFDSSHILQLLHTEGITHTENTEGILQLAKEKQFSQACLLFFNMKMECMDGKSQSVHQKYSFNSLQTYTQHAHVKYDIDRKHLLERKQNHLCVKQTDSLQYSCFDTLACPCIDSGCHDDKGHHHSSNNAQGVNAELSDLKLGAETFENTKASKFEQYRMDNEQSEQFSDITKLSSDRFHSLECTGKVNLPVDSNGVSETNIERSVFKDQNNIKYEMELQESVERKVHTLNDPLRNLHTSCIKHRVDAKNTSYALFQKPVEYLEKWKLYSNEIKKS